jgi:hypothetical protein
MSLNINSRTPKQEKLKSSFCRGQALDALALAGDGTPVYTSAQFFADDRHRIEPI